MATDGETGEGEKLRENKRTNEKKRKKRDERQRCWGCLLGVGTVLRLEKDAWSMVK